MWSARRNSVVVSDAVIRDRKLGFLMKHEMAVADIVLAFPPQVTTTNIVQAMESQRRIGMLCSDLTMNIRPDIYAREYGEEAVAGRRFLNLGCGGYWDHPCWTGVDLEPANGVTWNFRRMEPLPIQDGAMKLVYTSHLLEHLTDAEVRFLLGDAFRCVEPGAFIRVTLPDFDLGFAAYRAGWRTFFTSVADYAPIDTGQSVGWFFLDMYAGNLPVEDGDLARLFSDMEPEVAMDVLRRRIEETDLADYAGHVNWFNCDRISRFLAEAGFVDVERSAFGQSRALVLRDTSYFDATAPEVSVFVEARKPA